LPQKKSKILHIAYCFQAFRAGAAVIREKRLEQQKIAARKKEKAICKFLLMLGKRSQWFQAQIANGPPTYSYAEACAIIEK
jgi:hypothetical protein